MIPNASSSSQISCDDTETGSWSCRLPVEAIGIALLLLTPAVGGFLWLADVECLKGIVRRSEENLEFAGSFWMGLFMELGFL